MGSVKRWGLSDEEGAGEVARGSVLTKGEKSQESEVWPTAHPFLSLPVLEACQGANGASSDPWRGSSQDSKCLSGSCLQPTGPQRWKETPGK